METREIGEKLKREQHISMITQAALPLAMTIHEEAEATSQDPKLKELRKHIVNATKVPENLTAVFSAS